MLRKLSWLAGIGVSLALAVPAFAAVETLRLPTDRGDTVRATVESPAKNAGGAARRPGLLVVGWLSCDPVMPQPGATGSHWALLRELAQRSGFVVLRVEKPEPCAEADFERELAGYRAGLRTLRARSDVDPARVFLLGISNGAAVAPLVAEPGTVRGLVVSGAWVKTWLEHMLAAERGRWELGGMPAAEVSSRLRLARRFYDRYLNQRLLPGVILRQHPELAPVWDDAPDHQYGRPAAFFQQLQALDLGAAWSKVDVPVLALYGQFDTLMERRDHQAIVDIVNRRHPHSARLVVVDGMDHVFGTQPSRAAAAAHLGEGALSTAAVETILAWLREQATR